MENTVKRCDFVLENLTCAHCAGKIEKKINEHPDVESAQLNFVSKKLSIMSNKREKELYAELSTLVDRIEPGV
ncbi:MAG: cation transporter, partial [Bacilli bacterium]